MDSKKKNRPLELLKTVLILLLSFSSVYLLGRASLTGADGTGLFGHLGTFFGQEEAVPTPKPGQGGIVRPVRLVVMTGTQGRYGVQYDQDTVDSRYGELANLFSDALTTAGTPRVISQHTWENMLTGNGRAAVYLDLLGAVPTADLPAWMGGRVSNAALRGESRHVLLFAGNDGGALLSYINEADGLYYACNTSLDLADRLVSAVASFTPNGAWFAFEDPAQYATLAPYTLLLSEPKSPKVYAASNPIPSESESLTAFLRDLDFRPQNSIIHPDDLVVREGSDTLRVTQNGTVTFYSAGAEDPRYPIAAAGPTLTRTELVEGAWSLLETWLVPRCGAARLYLTAITDEDDGSVALTFSYQLSGATVQVGSDGFAARLVVHDGRVATFVLQPRAYEDTGRTSIVLPVRQAAAALDALDTAAAELTLCYRDLRGDTVEAGWVAR